MFWLAIVLLGLGVVASLWPREYPQGHQKFGQRYCYPVFAVLAGFPAMFLITTHLAHVSGFASAIFWLTWSITLIVVAAVTRKGGFWGALVALLAAMAFVLLPLGSNFGSPASTPQTSAQQNVGGAKAQAQASPGTGTAPDSCDAAYVQQWENNPDYRVIDGGLYEDVAHHKITPEQADKKQREVAGHDVRALAGYAYSEGLTDDANYTNLMTHDKKCLSTQGIALLKKLFGKWDSSKVSIAQAPASATNSGMENGALVVNATGGITGDRTALKRDYGNGKSTYALARCGNPVFPGKPAKVPPGRTDQHPSTPPSTPSTPSTPTPSHTTSTPTPTPSSSTPTPTPSSSTPTPTPSSSTPTPTPSCTTGQVDSPSGCLNTKDPGNDHHDPGNSGKPTAPAPSGTHETSTPVETHPADPSTKPGSGATDVPAPGSTQDTNSPTSAPTGTGAPTSGNSGTGSGDPDGGNTAMGLLAPFGLLGGAWLRRKRIDV